MLNRDSDLMTFFVMYVLQYQLADFTVNLLNFAVYNLFSHILQLPQNFKWRYNEKVFYDRFYRNSFQNSFSHPLILCRPIFKQERIYHIVTDEIIMDQWISFLFCHYLLQVSKYFSEIFKKLVPQGHAVLVMKKGDGGEVSNHGNIRWTSTYDVHKL